MKKVIVRAPVRADLAGGTLDLWPLYLFHPGSRTVNVAISHYAQSEVVETKDGAISIHLTDQQYRQRYESIDELGADPKAALIFRAVEHFHLTGIHITTRTDAPRGSGLGGSSALAITLVRALSEIAGHPVDGESLINLVRDLETRLLGIPAGIPDYYPPVANRAPPAPPPPFRITPRQSSADSPRCISSPARLRITTSASRFTTSPIASCCTTPASRISPARTIGRCTSGRSSRRRKSRRDSRRSPRRRSRWRARCRA